MDFLTEFYDKLRDLPALVQWAGYVGLTLIIFAETGLLVGFFLPGDSLLVTAGLLAADPRLSATPLVTMSGKRRVPVSSRVRIRCSFTKIIC